MNLLLATAICWIISQKRLWNLIWDGVKNSDADHVEDLNHLKCHFHYLHACCVCMKDSSVLYECAVTGPPQTLCLYGGIGGTSVISVSNIIIEAPSPVQLFFFALEIICLPSLVIMLIIFPLWLTSEFFLICRTIDVDVKYVFSLSKTGFW